MTPSHFRDIGGPVDVIVLLGMAAKGAVGATIPVYSAQSVFRRKPA